MVACGNLANQEVPTADQPVAALCSVGAILKDLAEVWSEEGRETTLKTAKDQPTTFFAVCARLIPSDVKLTVEQAYAGLSAEDYAVLRAIREAIPEANNQSPQAVLEYVLDRLTDRKMLVLPA